MADVTQEDLRQLRAELRQVRDVAEGILLALVGEKATMWRIEAKVQRWVDARTVGQPLDEIVGHSAAHLIWDEYEVAGARALRRLKREDVAALSGIGPVKMDKLDAALAAEDAAWGDMA
ncbi:MAG: hypothetical protein KDB58_07275 [Solirubrobacterales bacterium]|nr:hypothetical protein [Solirubrobacterales bacterium]MCB8970278.1 hypothetical protein [Thermoleophilales bacterium]MCB9617792.1 hypothetical protein [Sandaracinus sp.]